jgi:hypothetical protein
VIAYGGTCPLCCGDVQRKLADSGGYAVCSFCGLTFDSHDATSSPTPLSSAPPDLVGCLQTSGCTFAGILPVHTAAVGDSRAV